MIGPSKPCSTCGFKVVHDDLYCSWCGERLFQFEAVTKQVIFYHNLDKPKPITQRAELANRGWGRLTVRCLNAPDWVSIEPEGAIEIEPESSRDFSVTIHPPRMGMVMQEEGFELMFQIQPAGDTERIEISAWLEPTVDIGRLTLFNNYKSVETDLDLDSYCPMLIEAVRFDPPWAIVQAQLPLLVNTGPSSLPIRVDLPADTLNVPSLGYALYIRGLSEPIRGKIDISFEPAPELSVAENPNIYHELIDSGGEISLHLVNRSTVGALRISSISAAPAPESAQACRGLKVSAHKRLIPIPPGNSAQVVLEAIADAPVESGTYRYIVEIRSNDPNPAHHTWDIQLNVTDEPYPNYVSVDCGTTDSAVAVLELTSFRCLRLEPDSDDPKIFSNIYFTDYNPVLRPPWLWQIGRDARKAAGTGEGRKRLIRAVKTRIGSNCRELVLFPGKANPPLLPAEDILQFILMDLLKRTTKGLKRRPVKFFLCVPTRFTLLQKELMRKALKDACATLGLREESVVLVDESYAAGLFCLYQKDIGDASIRKRDQYTMMILDFGGGTTDATVFRVRQGKDPEGRTMITGVEILGAWGNPRLGGEAISDEIAAKLLGTFSPRSNPSDSTELRKLEVEAEALKLAVSYLEKFPKGGEEMSLDDLVQKAEKELRENLGFLAFRRRDGISDVELRELLKNYKDTNGEIRINPAEFPSPAGVHRTVVTKIFEERLSKLRQDLLVLLKRIGLDRVDLLMLAGQSSQFPVFKTVLKELGTIEYVRDFRGKLVLKECVSQGALMVGFLQTQLNMTGHNRLWTRLATLGVIQGGLAAIDRIEWGTSYPCESKPFAVNEIVDNRVRLEVLENTSLSERPDATPFGVFLHRLEGSAEGEYQCRLKLNDRGEVGADCKIGDGWQPMEFKPWDLKYLTTSAQR